MINKQLLDDPRVAKVYKMLNAAGKAEARARYIEENETEFVPPCDSNFEGKFCVLCLNYVTCKNFDANYLYEEAWQGYHNAEGLIRRQMEKADSEGSNAVLAQVLMDIHIHPNSGMGQDTIALWEAQYLWLKLFFRTRNESYLDLARLCEGFRNANAVRTDEFDE